MMGGMAYDPVTLFFGLKTSQITAQSAVDTLTAQFPLSQGSLTLAPGPIDDALHDGRTLYLGDGLYTLGDGEAIPGENNPDWRQVIGTGKTVIRGNGSTGSIRTRLKRVKFTGCNFILDINQRQLGAELGSHNWLDNGCTLNCEPLNSTFWTSHVETWGQAADQPYASWYATRSAAINTMLGFSYFAAVIGCKLGPGWAYTLNNVRTAVDNDVADILATSGAHIDCVEHTFGVDELPRVYSNIRTKNCEGGMLRIQSGCRNKNYLTLDGHGINLLAYAGEPNWGNLNEFGDGVDGLIDNITISGWQGNTRFSFNPATPYSNIRIACGLHWYNAIEWLLLGRIPAWLDVTGSYQTTFQLNAVTDLALNGTVLQWSNVWPDAHATEVYARDPGAQARIISGAYDHAVRIPGNTFDVSAFPAKAYFVKQINFTTGVSKYSNLVASATPSIPPLTDAQISAMLKTCAAALDARSK